MAVAICQPKGFLTWDFKAGLESEGGFLTNKCHPNLM